MVAQQRPELALVGWAAGSLEGWNDSAMVVISQAVVMIALPCERRALLTEFPSTTHLSWECPTQRQQLHECLEKECILFLQRSELQVQEGKWSVVPLRTSDCETIFSFLFLRGLEETPVTGAKAVVRTHWNRIKNHTFPSSPFHLTVIFYCCYSAAFYTPENHELSKQTGRCWQPQKKNTMAGYWGTEAGRWWLHGKERLPMEPMHRKEKKNQL